MTNRDIYRNMSGIHPQLITDAAPKENEKSTIKLWTKWGVMAACFIMIIAIVTTIIPHIDNPHEDLELPDALENIVWALQVSDTLPEISDGYTEWNGLTVKMSLKNALENRDNAGKYFAVTIFTKEQSNLDSFAYNGKTYKELGEEIEQNSDRLSKLSQIEKDGPYICWGETLYTTGIPADVPIVGGEKWSKESYDERIAIYGEEFLSEFIHDGKFEASAVAEEQKTRWELYNSLEVEREAFLAEYKKQSSIKVLNELQQKNKNICVRQWNGNAVMFVTAQELSSIKLSNLSEYAFGLYLRSDYNGNPVPAGGDIPE